MGVSKVYLLYVPLESDYKHTFYFENKTKQMSYFESLQTPMGTFTNFQYQRKDGYIRLPIFYDDALKYNYVMYQNEYRWYYAFIKDYEYVNENYTKIYIETDVMQTWLGNYSIEDSFIEREHVDSDEPGEHILDEGLTVIDYTVNAMDRAGIGGTTIGEDDEDEPFYVVFGVTENINSDDSFVNTYGGQYTGIYSGLAYYAYKHSDSIGIDNFVSAYASGGKTDSIICMFLAPRELIEDSLIAIGSYQEVLKSKLPTTLKINDGDRDFTFIGRNNNLDGYIPNNNKLLTYPYRYLLVSNNAGVDCIYRYENFKTADGVKYTTKPLFRIDMCLTPGCSIRMIPLHYKNQSRVDVEGINLGKYPTLNWVSDYYTNWLTQNAVSIGIQSVSAGVNIITGVASALTGNVAGGISTAVGGVTSIANTLNSMYQADLVPNQAHGNTNCGDVITSSGYNDFIFYDMSLKNEQAKMIDKYFDMFGYKVNRVGIPLSNHRRSYWYTKTVDIHITGRNNYGLPGQIPNSDLEKIKQCYNNGITFWRNEVVEGYDLQIGNYNVVNNIL